MAGNIFSGSPFWLANPLTGAALPAGQYGLNVTFGPAAAVGDGGNAWQLSKSEADGQGRPLAVLNGYFDGMTNRYARGDVNGAFSVEKGRAIFYTEAPSQTLASGAVFTGATRDVGVAAGALCPFPRLGVFVNASQAGTLTIQGSDDNFASSYVVATQAVAAATPLDIVVPVRARYHRAVFTNGATAQTAITLKMGYQT